MRCLSLGQVCQVEEGKQAGNLECGEEKKKNSLAAVKTDS